MQSHANLKSKTVLIERRRPLWKSRLLARRSRRSVAALCALAVLVLLCAGAAIVSHARTANSAAINPANGSEEQGGAQFSELEHGGLGS